MQSTFSWEAPEYTHREKKPDWFWALGIIGISGTVAALIFNNVLLALLVLVGTFTVALYAARHPSHVRFTVGERGITVDNRLYPYGTLDAYWLDDQGHPDIVKLIIRSKKLFMPYLIIPAEHTIAHELNRYLTTRLKSEEMNEPLAEKILNLFGF